MKQDHVILALKRLSDLEIIRYILHYKNVCTAHCGLGQ